MPSRHTGLTLPPPPPPSVLQESLPSYPTVKNGSILNMHGQRPPVPKVEAPPKPKQKPVANSVLTMGKMFDRGEIPGSHLSDLQEADMIRMRGGYS